MLHGTSEEAEEMLRNIGTGSKTASELAAQLVIMKRLLDDCFCNSVDNISTSNTVFLCFYVGRMKK